jgi:hypothetical protein
MSASVPIEIGDGQTLLVIVKDGRVMEYTWDMGLPHVEFVRRRAGELPAGAWVGTVSKIDGQVVETPCYWSLLCVSMVAQIRAAVSSASLGIRGVAVT